MVRNPTGEGVRAAARERNAKVIDRFVSTGMVKTIEEMIAWAIVHAPHPEQWTRQRMHNVLYEWRSANDELSSSAKRADLWCQVHEMMTTRYNAKQICDIFNANRTGWVDRPWTVDALLTFHKAGAKKYHINIDPERSIDEALEIAFRYALMQADGYSIVDTVDLFNEERYAFSLGKPWTNKKLDHIVHRARRHIANIEEMASMSAAIDFRDGKAIEHAAISTIDTVLRVVSQDDDDPVDKREALAFVEERVRVMITVGASKVDIAKRLDADIPKANGWSVDDITAVQTFIERREGALRPRERKQRGDYQPAFELIIDMRERQFLTIAQTVERLNNEGVVNCVEVGRQWSAKDLTTVVKSVRAKLKKLDEHQADELKKFPVGVRKMRAGDIAAREYAREQLVAKSAAFDRAKELHKQMMAIKEQIADAQYEIDQYYDAEQFLLTTGPAELMADLEEKRSSRGAISRISAGIDEKIESAQQQVADIRQLETKIKTSDYR